MKLILALLAATALSFAAPAFAADPAPNPMAVAPSNAPPSVAVSDNGLVGLYYPPVSGKRSPAVLVLGGSEGGMTGAYFLGGPVAAHGFAVLGVAYFGAEGLPANLQDVPLEYLDKALAWLRAQPGVDPDRVAVYGISKGGELALLLASRHPEIKAVVAGVPSSVVWQGINMSNWAPKSSWDENGAPVPYLPYDVSKGFSSIRGLYEQSLTHLDEHPDAVIPVERINGPVLLISGQADLLWPSTPMSEAIMARLDAHHFQFKHLHLSYVDAGHAVASPPNDRLKGLKLSQLGGTDAGNDAGRADMWPKVLAFLDEALK